MTDPRNMQAPTGFHEDRALDRADLLDDPIAQFQRWLSEAEAEGIALPNAMAVATADAQAHSTVRHVLLRGVDDLGFVFYTNRESRKGQQLAENPHAGLVFFWKELDRQVCITGSVTETSAEESDAYFATRPRDAQLGAWASHQSQVLAGREDLEDRIAQIGRRFPADVPRPAHWGGYRVTPASIEFWQGRRHRLHDRFRYTRVGEDWDIDRLSP
jgi:pyridoxamine 5'-phosphate oxidase